MTDINTAIDNIVTQVASAAAALTNPIADVSRGDPIPGSGRCVRVWYGGEVAPVKMGRSTLNSEITGELAIVTCYWPMSSSDLAVAQDRDKEIFTLKGAIRTNILAHSTLSGTVTDLDVSYGRPDFVIWNGTPYRVFEYEVTLEFSEYPISA